MGDTKADLAESLRETGRARRGEHDFLMSHQARQYYVYRYRDTIRKTYQMLPLDLQDEEDYYLESLLREGQEMCLQIRKRQGEMIGEDRPQAIHKELMEMCYKPDVELLQELGDKLKCEHFIQQRGQQSAHEAAGSKREAEVPVVRPGRAFGRRGAAVRPARLPAPSRASTC
ncbi:Tripartite motif-containing protein 43 [Camelus dromedarius]|uniref:Tripartite motif-containing protein 43 n=1 Tax=Camelus dromedarius TaxID=9838 RepID=A0A5N4DM80_CAMDR|nr:Tripartite motif-containing protein 43 [Camelus dromedarius]